jgi:hypothetical protein
MPSTSGFENFGNLVSNNQSTTIGDTEDSWLAIFVLAMASYHNHRPDRRLMAEYESDFLPWTKERNRSDFSAECFRTATVFQKDCLFRPEKRSRLNPFLAELFSQGLLRRLGIRTGSTRICAVKEARELPPHFFVKVISGERRVLRWNQAGNLAQDVVCPYCLVSELVPQAATADYISRRFQIRFGTNLLRILTECASCHDGIDRSVARLIGKSCEPAHKFYADFKPSDDEMEAIKGAMLWDGPQYLRLCAARVFLGISAPHTANFLVTRGGQLVSLDHCNAHLEDGEDLRKLFHYVRRDTAAFNVLSDVAALTDADIFNVVAQIARHPAYDSTAGLADYFCKRLQLWKELFSGSEASRGMERVAATA